MALLETCRMEQVLGASPRAVLRPGPASADPGPPAAPTPLLPPGGRGSLRLACGDLTGPGQGHPPIYPPPSQHSNPRFIVLRNLPGELWTRSQLRVGPERGPARGHARCPRGLSPPPIRRPAHVAPQGSPLPGTPTLHSRRRPRPLLPALLAARWCPRSQAVWTPRAPGSGPSRVWLGEGSPKRPRCSRRQGGDHAPPLQSHLGTSTCAVRCGTKLTSCPVAGRTVGVQQVHSHRHKCRL